jgi:mono/diheme cytochrome c family protein
MLDADYTFIDERLASFYGLPWKISGSTDGEEPGTSVFQKVSLASTPRRGVLTHGSVLTLTSYPTRTSPVQRGKWILENVLGTPPPEPPPNVPELEATKADEGASVREQLALHRANPACASCHRVMDQLGFGFEQFDAIGQFRGGDNVDASGELPGGRVFEGGQQLAAILRKTESKRFATTVAQRLLGFSLGRELSPDDRCVIDKIVAENEATDYRLADLVTSVVLSRPFQYFHPEHASTANASPQPEPKE